MTDDKKREILAQVGRVNSDICYGCPIIERYLELMSAQPEIVRCKDCVNSGTSRCPCHYSGDPHIDWNPDDDWFCADGERKEVK